MKLFGIRELKSHITKLLRGNAPFAVTRKGEPIGVFLPLEMYRRLDPDSAIEAIEAAAEITPRGGRARKRRALKFEFLK